MNNKLDIAFATPEEIRRLLAGRLKSVRLQQNLQQQEVAAMAGISRGTLVNLESKAQCSLDAFVSVAVALGVSEDFAELFLRKPRTIAEMEHQEYASFRKRASARTPS